MYGYVIWLDLYYILQGQKSTEQNRLNRKKERWVYQRNQKPIKFFTVNYFKRFN